MSRCLDLAEQGQLTVVSIGGNSKTVSVFLEAEQKTATLDDDKGLNAISDWLSLATGAARKAKQPVERPRFTARGLVDTAAPSVLSS